MLLGRFSHKLWRAYSLWFVIGTAGAPLGPQRATPSPLSTLPPLSTPLPPQQPSPLNRPRPPPPPPTPGALLGPARYLVGWQPLQSMEQIGPLLVFGLLQGLQLAASLAHRLKLDPARAAVLRMQVGLGSRAVLYSVAAAVGSLPSTFYRH